MWLMYRDGLRREVALFYRRFDCSVFNVITGLGFESTIFIHSVSETQTRLTAVKSTCLHYAVELLNDSHLGDRGKWTL